MSAPRRPRIMWTEGADPGGDNGVIRAAAGALSNGEHARARDLLQPLATRYPRNQQVWMMLADAHAKLGEVAAMEAAADHLLSVQPQAVRPYGWKGDACRARGDDRAAAGWYKQGVRYAAMLQSVPEALAEEIARQEAAIAELDQRFAAELAAGLAAAGMATDAVSERFGESVAILNGDVPIRLQAPTTYYFPGLPQRAFYEREEFDWVTQVEAQTDRIAGELARALTGDGGFTPYLKQDPTRPHQEFHGMHGNADWSGLNLIEQGAINPAMAERFAHTLTALEAAPLCRISVRAPTIMFSLLKGGARIPPHHGMINARLICHLPLVVPGNGALRVGNQTRAWERGKLLIFDDSIEHEARNDADADRIVLIFDVWRPELTMAEREAVAALFGVVDAKKAGAPN